MSFNSNVVELFILLLADDNILLSEIVVGLQNQLNNLYHAACNLQLLDELDERGNINWVSRVRHLLSYYGFMYVWKSQGVGCLDICLKMLKQRLMM